MKFLARPTAAFALLLIVIGLFAPGANAKGGPHPGLLDRGFGDRGVLLVPGSDTASRTVASAADGRLVVAENRSLRAYRADGSVDRHFGQAGSVKLPETPGLSFSLAGVVIDSRGRVLVAGTTASPQPTPGPAEFPGPQASSGTVYRFLPNGRLDPSFGAGGATETTFAQQPPTGPGPYGPYPYPKFTPEFPYSTVSVEVSGLAIDDQDRPVLTGTSAAHATKCGERASVYSTFQRRSFSARLTSAGALDPSFGSGGVVTDPTQEAQGPPVVGSDGRIVLHSPLGSCSSRLGSPQYFVVTTLDQNGTQLGRFVVEQGRSSGIGTLSALALDGRNRLLLLARRPENGWTKPILIERRRPDGQRDQSFGRGGVVGLDRASTFTVDSRNRVLLAGPARAAGGRGAGLVVSRLTAAGAVDRRFGDHGAVSTYLPASSAFPFTISVDARDRILVGAAVRAGGLRTGNGLAFARYLGGP